MATPDQLLFPNNDPNQQNGQHLPADDYITLIYSFAQATWETNAQGKIVTDAPSWRAYTGQTLTELMEDGWAAAVHYDDYAQVLVQWQQSLRAKIAFQVECRLQRDDGRWTWTNVRAVPIRRAGGTILKWVGFGIDITERKQLEEDFHQNEARQAFLLQLGDALRPLADPVTIQATAARLLGQHLGANQVHYGEAIGQEVVIHQGYGHGLPPMVGRFRSVDFGQHLTAFHQRGRVQVVADVETDPFNTEAERQMLRMASIGAYITAPLLKDGQWVATLAVHSIRPRGWTTPDVELVNDVAERTWASVERAKAEETLRQLEQRSRMALEAARMATWEWDLETNQVYWNDQHYKLLGMDIQTGPLPADAFLNHLHPEDAVSIQRQLQQTSQQGSPYDAEFRVIREDGATRWMHGYGRVTATDADRPVRVSGVMVDITDRKAAQEALQQSEQQLAELRHLTLLAQTEALARIGSWDFHRFSGLFTWSAGMYQLMGIDSGQELQPELYLSVATEEDQSVAERLVSYFHQGSGHFEGQLRVRVGGQTKTLRIKAEVIGEGDATRVVGVDIDITEQLLAQWQIHETAENLQAVLDASPASIGLLKAVHDPADPEHIVNFRLAVGNDKLAHFFEQPLSKLLGQSAARFGALLWGRETLTKLRRVYTTRLGIYEEKPLPPPNQGRWIAVSATRQDDGVVLTGLDITELKQAQSQQQHWLDELSNSRQNVETLKTLKTALQHRSESLRAVSHDLKGNFGIINSSLSLLELASSEAERAQLVEMALRNVQQATGLLSDLLDLTRLESSEQDLRLGYQNVAVLFGELGESLELMADQQGLTLKLLGPDTLAVETDSLLLYRLVQNLLMNAIKYTARGSVELSWGLDKGNDRWWLTVADTGPGLAQELVNRLNTPVSDLIDATSLADTVPRSISSGEGKAGESWAHLRGEGIGLRIVREIANLLQAQLQVSSKAGLGTWFVVYLPLQYVQ